MMAISEPVKAAWAALVEAMRDTTDRTVLPDSGFDPSFIEKQTPLLEFLWAKYFRVKLSGMENVPLKGPALVVANHSGGLPYDGAMLIYAFHRNHPEQRPLRTLVANFAFRSPWMSGVMSRLGGVRASMQNALSLLERGNLVGVFPEGLKGVGKLFRDRYRLANFGHGGFVRLARKAGVPIIPVAIVGAEEIHPIIAKITSVAKPLGLPYIPITPTFPLLGPLGLLPVPTKWTIQIGKPMDAGSEGVDTGATAEAVRARIDKMIGDVLSQRRSIFFG